jgi:hypothetical protein
LALSRAWDLHISSIIFHVHFSEVFHQQAVDEDISATDAAQEDQVNAVVEEVDESPREEVVTSHVKPLECGQIPAN